MRLAHARPTTVTLMAGSVLLTATSGISLTVAANTAAASAPMTSSGKSCEPLQLPASPPSPSPSPTSTSSTPTTPTATPTTPTATPTTPATTPTSTASTPTSTAD